MPRTRLPALSPTFALACALTLAATPAHAEDWQPAKGLLVSRWARDVSPTNALTEYPRPHMARTRWQNLDGLWDYRITPSGETGIPHDHDGKILVPFCIEAPLSGVMKPLKPDQRLWYQREFTIPAGWDGQRVLLHFGAVDWETTVFVDGHRLGTHRGGYDGFSFDVTRHLGKGPAHTVAVSVWDPTEGEGVLHGKQTLHPGGCSYTAVSGIWQTVWLEPVPLSAIDALAVVPDLEAGRVRVTVNARVVPRPLRVHAILSDQGTVVAEASGGIGDELTPDNTKNMVDFFKATSAEISAAVDLRVPSPRAWSPESPFLYDLTVKLEDADGHELDAVTSYAGMRSVRIGHDTDGHTRLLLNGTAVLLPGALDQGYWPDGIYTAPTDAALRFDLEFAKSLGLNSLRKHVKVEPERWYYWADRLGVLVLQDLPTGDCGDPFTDQERSPAAGDQWRAETAHLIEQRAHHPSIICWDLFNEAFGGFDYARNTAWVKRLDPTRLTNESSGFPFHGTGEVADGHGGIDFKDPRRITIISEWGTASMGCANHTFPHAWSYGSYDPKTGKETDFLAYYNKNRDTAELPNLTPEARIWLTGKVGDFFATFLREAPKTARSGQYYCQLVDVETECNGLISYDREVPKVDAKRLAEVIRASTPLLTTKPER